MRGAYRWLALGTTLLVALPWWGCEKEKSEWYTPSTGGGGSVPDAGPEDLGVGEPCAADGECRDGLACEGGFCAPGHATPEGDPCIISGECAPGLFCADGACTPGGSGIDGNGCSSDADCADGFRCELAGLGAVCVPEGDVDVGGSCEQTAECFGGLACVEGVCAVMPPGFPPFGPPWEGTDCPEETGPVAAYFRAPRGTDDGDFYRLPFPNDVRLVNGKPDFTGHPTPGDALLGYDLVDRYLRAIEQSGDGWGLYTPIYFRFRGGIDTDTLYDNVKLVNLTQGNNHGFWWRYDASRSKYICGHRLFIRRGQGNLFSPGETYAAYITTDVKAHDGTEVERPADLDALLGDTLPTDPTLAEHWPKYAPLRTYLADNTIATDTILTATVFTIGHPRAIVEKLQTSIEAAGPPPASGWVRCDTGVDSPCPDTSGSRACEAADPDFDELHALVELPIFQQGTAPHIAPTDGGDIATDGNGDPLVVRTEEVCLSLTIPKGAAPPAGWPTVVFAHGTGGHFRSHVVAGLAKELAAGVDDGTSNVVPMAMLGIDQVAHGPRRAGSDLEPYDLYFNITNPHAARGNPQQGAADQMSLLRLVPAISFDAGSSPTGEAFGLSSAVALWGHSQGATVGGIALPYGPWAGAVLSGQGASLRDALVSKTSPVDIAGIMPWVLSDPDGEGKLMNRADHPVLSWLQTYIDGADPLAYAMLATKTPPAGITAHHVFQPYGLDDTYTPSVVQATYALAARMGLVAHDASVSTPDELGSPPVEPIATPASGNLDVDGEMISAFVRQYAPAQGEDGHFVVLDVASARADAERFLAGVLAGIVPQVGE